MDPVVPASVRSETEYAEIDVPECTVHLDFLLDPDLVRIDGPRQLPREESLTRDELRPSGVEDSSGEGLDELGVGETAEVETSVQWIEREDEDELEDVGGVDCTTSRREECILLENPVTMDQYE